MHLAVWLPLLACLPLAEAAPSVVGRLAPAEATRVLTWLALFAAAATTWTLALLVVGGLGRVDEVQDRLHSDSDAVASLDSVPRFAGALAALALAAVLVNAGRVLVGTWRGQRDIRRALAGLPGGQLVVLRDPGLDAYAAPGGRILVSTGLLDTLDAAGRRALLAHERAHLRYHHARYLLAVRVAAALNPVLIPLRRAVDFQVERWADEHAAGHAGRDRTARALAHAALAWATPTPTSSTRDTATPGYLRHRVTDRVAALLAPQPATHWAAAVPSLLIGAAAALALLDATGDCADLLLVLWR